MLAIIQLYLVLGLVFSTFTAINVVKVIQKLNAGDSVKCWGKDKTEAIKRANETLSALEKFTKDLAGSGNWMLVIVATALAFSWFKDIFLYPRALHRLINNKVYVRVSKNGIVH